MKLSLFTIALLVAPQLAHAQSCDAVADRLASTPSDGLARLYGDLLACSKPVAEARFSDFVRKAQTTDDLVTLALVAIDAQSYLPVWSMLDHVREYSQRDEVAAGVGAACPEHPGVVNFLQGAYFGLKNTEFGRWDPALSGCSSDALATWIDATAAAPPTSSYDEKYNTMLTALVIRRGPDALPVLKRAAVEAATKGGPFNVIIEKMNDAVQPRELGADITPENRKRLETELVTIAGSVAPEQAAMIADRLYNAGAESAAAGLLPYVYPGKVQANGGLLYGVAAIEACGNEAVIHYRSVSEPARRWSILNDVAAPARAVKARLKCTPEGEWPVIATNEPISSDADLYPWVTELQQVWENKGNAVKSKQEAAVALP